MNKYIFLLFLILSSCAPKQGPMGEKGERGLSGENGHSMVFTTLNATIEQCANGGKIILIAIDINNDGYLDNNDTVHESIVLCNGIDSQTNQFNPVVLLDPCGTNPKIQNQVLLKLYDNTILTIYSENGNSKNTRFISLMPGTYKTNDGDNCIFNLDNNGVISNESHRY